MDILRDVSDEAKVAYDRSTLPDAPNHAKVSTLCTDVVKLAFHM